MKINLKGTGVALVTPFNADKSVDYNSLSNLIDHVISNGSGVEYVVSLGTTGESATLNDEEKNKILDFTIEKVNGRVPIVAGFGGNDTNHVIQAISKRNMKGIDAILSVSPYYNKPTQTGIYEHYKAIAQATDLPIILYNVPPRTSSNISADTTLKLANDFKNIVAIKEASGDLIQCMKIVREKPSDFWVISGEDLLTLPMIAFGMDGVISVIANVYPKDYAEMVRLALRGNFKEATELQFRLMDIVELLFVEGNPGGAKCALEILGVCQNVLRLPLVPVGEITYERLRKKIADY